jgi:cephalosporin hydroxylase
VRRRAPDQLDAALEYVFKAKPGGIVIDPIQVRSELRDFLLLVQRLEPRALVEIGTARGGTLFLFTRVAAPDAMLVTVDLSSAHDSRFGAEDISRRRPLYESFAIHEQRVEFVIGDSHAPETVARVRAVLAGRPVDVLFIDGDHSFEGVSRDFELYRELVRAGGVIAFHDIVPGPVDAVGGVPEFWQAIRTNDARELVEDPSQTGYGIGVLRV